jgi:uncharacterized protein YuzE
MKVIYDKEVDTLYIKFSDSPVKESDEDKPGIVLDYAVDGSIVGIEIMDASKRFPEPEKIELEIA